jgi:prepilin-type N-terminal cleavage/methylation domain-containing protein
LSALSSCKIKKVKKHKNSTTRAFTLIELLVVIAIFTIITSIAIFDQGKLNSQVLLTNLTYDTALSIREAQSYGVGVRQADPNNLSGNFQSGVGVFFDTNPSGIDLSDNQSVIIFNNPNSTIDNPDVTFSSESNRLREYHFQNQRGNYIYAICQNPSDCLGQTTHPRLRIMFFRPNPEPVFYLNDDPDPTTGPFYIVLRSADASLCSVIVVNSSGQVNIEGNDSDACRAH